jgi:hypothetical protein
VEARELGLRARDQSSGQDNFRTAIGALQDCNMVEQLRAETSYGGPRLPVVHLHAFEECDNRSQQLVPVKCETVT